MADEIHVGDVGTLLQLTVKETDENGVEQIVDMSSFTSLIITIYLQKPSSANKEVLTKSGIIVDGPNGKIGYITQSGDLTDKGTWKIQAHLGDAPSGWYTTVVDFSVLPNLA